MKTRPWMMAAFAENATLARAQEAVVSPDHQAAKGRPQGLVARGALQHVHPMGCVRRSGGIGEWIMYRGKHPCAVYQAYAKDFNPVKQALRGGVSGDRIFCAGRARPNVARSLKTR